MQFVLTLRLFGPYAGQVRGRKGFQIAQTFSPPNTILNHPDPSIRFCHVNPAAGSLHPVGEAGRMLSLRHHSLTGRIRSRSAGRYSNAACNAIPWRSTKCQADYGNAKRHCPSVGGIISLQKSAADWAAHRGSFHNLDQRLRVVQQARSASVSKTVHFYDGGLDDYRRGQEGVPRGAAALPISRRRPHTTWRACRRVVASCVPDRGNRPADIRTPPHLAHCIVSGVAPTRRETAELHLGGGRRWLCQVGSGRRAPASL